MAQEFVNAGTEPGELTITLVGNFGATAPVSGDGSLNDEYNWFDFGDSSDRRVTLNFSGCKSVKLTQGAKYYCLFKGNTYTIKNLCLIVDGAQSEFNGQNYMRSNNIYFENCRIIANVNAGWLFNAGTFRDCEFTLKIAGGVAAVFRPLASRDVLRIYGGKYLAYTSSSDVATVIHCADDISNAIIIADGVNCPTVAEEGYQQTHAVYDLATSNYHRYLNIISSLILHAPSQTIRDTIVASKQ
jgi:hypothetical protein